MPKKISNFKDSLPEQGKLKIVDPKLRKIEGVVMSGKEPLIGANIAVKKTTVGTTTDFDGIFRLTFPLNTKTIIVSYTGFKTQEYTISDDTWDNTGKQKKIVVIRLKEY
jgi:hypothetical protein